MSKQTTGVNENRTKIQTPAGHSTSTNGETEPRISSNPSTSQNIATSNASNIIVEHVSDVPKMWTGRSLLPSYFVTLEKYFISCNIIDENISFVSLSNITSPEQIETYSLSLSRAFESDQPNTTLKRLILAYIVDDCTTDWIDALSKIQYKHAQEKLSELMSRLAAVCKANPNSDAGAHDLIERTFIHLQPENVQNILKAKNFVSLHEQGIFANRFHSQIHSQNYCTNTESNNDNTDISQIANKLDELCTEVQNVKLQEQKPCNSFKQQSYPPNNSWQNRSFTQFKSGRNSGRYNFRNTNSRTWRNTNSNSSNQNGFCKYHSKFGARAYRCEKPCSFRTSNTRSVSVIDSNKSVSLASELHLPKVYDKLSEKLFLIDTGASANFLPVSSENSSDEIQSQFVNASGNLAKCFGSTRLEIDIGFGKMTDVFHLCAIEQPILEFDFFKSNNIILDAATCSLSLADFPYQINVMQASISLFDSLPAHESKYTNLLQNYPDLTAPPDYRKPVKQNIVHHLPTKGRPPNIKTRRVSPEKYQQIKRQIENMLESGLIIPSNSEYGSPLHVVTKTNGTELRLVGD